MMAKHAYKPFKKINEVNKNCLSDWLDRKFIKNKNQTASTQNNFAKNKTKIGSKLYKKYLIIGFPSASTPKRTTPI